jgi:hypothetical protein
VREEEILRGDLRRSFDFTDPVAVGSLYFEETSLSAGYRGVEDGHDAEW